MHTLSLTWKFYSFDILNTGQNENVFGQQMQETVDIYSFGIDICIFLVMLLAEHWQQVCYKISDDDRPTMNFSVESRLSPG